MIRRTSQMVNKDVEPTAQRYHAEDKSVREHVQ